MCTILIKKAIIKNFYDKPSQSSGILNAFFRCSTDKAYSKLLEKELWDLLPHIHQAASSAAYHWAFLLLCDVIGSYYDDVELLNKFTKMLTDVGYAYGQSFTETQKVLDARLA